MGHNPITICNAHQRYWLGRLSRVLSFPTHPTHTPVSWSSQCTFGHDSDAARASYSKYPAGSQLGQNYAESGSSSYGTAKNLESMFLGWYNEIRDMPPSVVDAYVDSEAYGHFTQVVWGETAKVGCGFVAYAKNDVYKQVRTELFGLVG